MPTWNSRGLRGSVFEEMLNETNETYRRKKLALIQKVPTPIKPMEIDPATRHITLAYFDQKSTVDYIGAVQGIPVCFDAKECQYKTFPLANIHEHQMKFMEEFEDQQGISFILVYYSELHEVYYIPFTDLLRFWNRGMSGGRKSFTYDEINKDYRVPIIGEMQVHYLEALQKDLSARDEINSGS